MPFLYDSWDSQGQLTTASSMEWECTVVRMLDKTYGKMPDTLAQKQLVLEYKYYLETFVKSTTFNENQVSAELSA